MKRMNENSDWYKCVGQHKWDDDGYKRILHNYKIMTELPLNG